MSDSDISSDSVDLGLKRKLSFRESAGWILGVVAFFVALAFGTLGYPWVAYVAAAVFTFFVVWSLNRMPPAQKAKMFARIERQQSSRFGRFMQILNWLLLIYLAGAVVYWLATRPAMP